MAKIGLPEIIISFKTQSTSAIVRSARGTGVLILNDSNVTSGFKYYKVDDVTDMPDGLTDANKDLINKALMGTPYRLHVYAIPMPGENVTVNQATILKEIKDAKWNYICHPTGTTTDQTDLADWIADQRQDRSKTFKAVVAAGLNAQTGKSKVDNYGVINFTTGNIKVENPAWTDAVAAGTSTANIDQYIIYTAAQYTSRIMGILCGLSLDRSATFYELPEVVSCAGYDDIDAAIDGGQLVLVDEKDGNGVKIARGVNSLHTTTTNVGDDFRYIKIVSALDMIKDDIRDTFSKYYCGKIINDYSGKMMFVSAVMIYLNNLKGNVLDASEGALNYVEIDVDANRDYAQLHGVQDVSLMTKSQLEKVNTGVNLYLRGVITPVNCLECLYVNFTL